MHVYMDTPAALQHADEPMIAARLLTRPYDDLFVKTPTFRRTRMCTQAVITVGSSRTFTILPRRVPGQAEERREEYNRSGHSSISEPHLISAMPLLLG